VNRLARVTENLFTLSIGIVTQKLLGGLLFVVLARYVGEADIGKYGLANSFSALFILFADMGLETIAIRSVTQHRAHASTYLVHTAVLRGAMAVFTFVIMGIGILWADFPDDKTAILWLVAGAISIGNMAGGFRWVFRAYEKFRYETVLIAGESLLMFAGGLVILNIGLGIVAFSTVRLLFAILISLAAIGLAVRLIRPAFVWDWHFARILLLSGLPIMALNLFDQALFNLDNVLLNMISGDIESGRYTAAYRLITMLLIIPGLFNMAVFPAIIQASNNSEEFIRIVERSLRYTLIIGLGVSIFVTVHASSLIHLLYSDRFSDAASMLQILVWMFLFHTISVVGINIAYSYHQEKAILTINGIGLLCNVILNGLMIPSWGGEGAAIAAILSRGLICLMMLVVLHRYVQGLSIGRIGLRPMLAGGMSLMVMILAAKLPIVIEILLGVLAYGASLWVLQAITQQDIRLFSGLISHHIQNHKSARS